MTTHTPVHNPRDWETLELLPILHIDGKRYVRLGKSWHAQQDRSDSYAKDNLPAFAEQFHRLTQASGAKIEKAKPCIQAGKNGHWWNGFGTSSATLQMGLKACIADDGGALLKLVMGAHSNSLAGQHITEI